MENQYLEEKHTQQSSKKLPACYSEKQYSEKQGAH